MFRGENSTNECVRTLPENLTRACCQFAQAYASANRDKHSSSASPCAARAIDLVDAVLL